MGHTTPADIKKQVRIYILVFAALAVLTIVTVLASYLNISFAYALTLALVIASIKGFLVAAYFMHLISEKRIIYGVLAITVLLFLHLLLLPIFTEVEAIGRHVS